MEKKRQLFIFRITAAVLLIIFCHYRAAAQDSLVLKNKNIIVGEIKSLDKGVLVMETPYSKSDFSIEWTGVKEIYSKTIFLITLKDGRRLNGSFRSEDGGEKVSLQAIQDTVLVPLDDIVFLKGLKSSFWSRLRGSIDMGLSLTKANNLRQLNINTKLGYLADKWQLDGYYNMNNSSQDSVATTKRTDAGATYNYFLQKDWYLLGSINFLSNTEQAIELRTTGKLGAGKFLMHTNRNTWGVGAGLSFNNETFTNNTSSRSSLEGYIGTELNLFDIGDLNLLSTLYIYPSFTESGRLRTDFKVDCKYDFPMDFYLKTGLTLNYDNRPAVAGNQTDYVLAFSVGWEL